MATLTGQKVKDSYQSILKLASGTLTTSNIVVEDGAGNDSALSLSTTDVQVNGTLNFGTTPSSSSTELSVLLVDGTTGDVVTRELDASAFSGGSVSVASPIAIVSGNVTIGDAGNLSALTALTVASDDKILIWDESTNVWKQIGFGQISSGGAGLNMLVSRAKEIATVASGGTYSTVTFEDAQTPATTTSSVYVGSGANYLRIEADVLSGDTLALTSPGTYSIDISANFNISSGTPNITVRLYDKTNSTEVIKSIETAPAGEYVISFFHVVTIVEENRYKIDVTCSSNTATLTDKSQVSITYLT